MPCQCQSSCGQLATSENDNNCVELVDTTEVADVKSTSNSSSVCPSSVRSVVHDTLVDKLARMMSPVEENGRDRCC